MGHDSGIHGGLHGRFLAWFMAREGSRYEEMVGDRKQALMEELRGTVVEVGSGTGPNLRYLSAGVRFVGLDPNPYMHQRLVDEAQRLRRRPLPLLADAMALPFPDGCADAVLSTLVLCSVPELNRVLAEVLRVLKPGGRLVFVEHVGGRPGSWTHRIQRAVKPVWRWVGDGCEPDRDTEGYLRGAGFSSVTVDRFRLPLPIVAPHISGTAVK